MVNILISDI